MTACKNILYKTNLTIEIKLVMKHSWMKGIQIYSNEGPCPFPRRDNSKKAYIHWGNFKIFFSIQTTGPIQLNLAQSILRVKGIQICSDVRPNFVSRGDNSNVYPTCLYNHISCSSLFIARKCFSGERSGPGALV